MHHFELRYGHRMYHLMDTPGARSLVADTIIGIAQADAALLIIDGFNTESFDKGMDQLQGGQTKEYALLA